MTIDELYLQLNNASFETLVCQTNIKNDEDLKQFFNTGCNDVLKLEEYQNLHLNIPAERIWYTPNTLIAQAIYYNPDTLATYCMPPLRLIQSNILKYSDCIAKKVQDSEDEATTGNFDAGLLTLPDSMKIEYFNLLLNKGIVINDLYATFIDYYNLVDYGNLEISKKNLRRIIASKTKKDQEKTTAALQGFPDTITVYRGENSESAKSNEAYSWTTNINVAMFFAIRRGNGPAVIVTGEVKKEKIIEYISDRNEDEVLCYPKDVKEVNRIELYGKDDLIETLPKMSRIFQRFSSQLSRLTFSVNSNVHGREHELHVLILSQYIAEKMNLCLEDKRILATAAIFHDTRRQTDNIEDLHGMHAKEYYCQVTENPNPIVAFLCEYHCLPDNEAYTTIENDNYLHMHQRRVRLLYDIFCDSDSLDRLRFGVSELDYQQLRTSVAKKSPLIAKIVADNTWT